MKKIPYGIINFKSLIEEDYIYVDKTMYLQKLEDTAKVITYFRPGRFGKSLFVSMMQEYYDISSKDNFKTLFKDTYVYKNPTVNKNNYYILRFDFSGISGETEFSYEQKFKVCIISGIDKFKKKYNVELDINDNYDAASIIKTFLSKVDIYDNKIYIMIDEYDNFTNSILEGDAANFKSAVGKNGYIKDFYAVLKEYYNQGIVDRIFITGICPITLNSMTTGFNISTDITIETDFNEMIGLTHDEVKDLIKTLEIENRDEAFSIMKENYDGYLFSENAGERVFNATLVMYFLREYIKSNGKVPTKLIDKNIVLNYGKIKDLVTLQNNEYYEEITETILKTSKIEGTLTQEYNLDIEFSRDDIVSLLFYFGYLTINSKITAGYEFKIPNHTMEETYNNYFVAILKSSGININTNREIYDEMVNFGTIEKLNTYVSLILQEAGNRTFMKFDEKYIQLTFFGVLRNCTDIGIFPEYALNGGYADLMILRRSEIAKYDIMIELKYIKIEDYKKNKKLGKQKLEEAVSQIEEYKKDKRLDKKHLRCYAIVFVGSKIYECAEVI